ncbi:MAG: hypothetical protein V2A69_03835 [Pseudomonadota bacterium]
MNLISKGIQKTIGKIGIWVFRRLPTKLVNPCVNLFLIIPKKSQRIDWKVDSIEAYPLVSITFLLFEVDLKIKSEGLWVRKAWLGLKFQENKRGGLGLGPVLASIPDLPYHPSYETEEENSGGREC